MRVSYLWLKELVETSLSPQELAELLTMGGLEVEGMEEVGGEFERVFIGEILQIRPHPRADRLSLCEVRVGGETLSIVCGATNIFEGAKVPVALHGAKLAKGVRIKRSKIRGEVSEGMLCSEEELGLGEDSTGIMILPDEAPPGEALEDYLPLKDYILEVSPTPNRGDCLSVLGVAREVAALGGGTLRVPSPEFPEEGPPAEEMVEVRIEAPELCPRYSARYLWDVKVGPSPLWMRLRLERAGIRAINNVVDITNYVMLELGQPLHAFDYDRIRGGKIVVRKASEGERFLTLDGKERVLDGETLLICDAEGPVAIAGVMGGLESEIEEETERVLLESAHFSPRGIRRTSQRLRLQTASSYRFERGVDPEGTILAASRAAALMRELASAKVSPGVVDAYPLPFKPRQIGMRPERVRSLLGLSLRDEEMMECLRRLGIEVREEGGRWVAVPPSWRFDLEREVDMAEEVARVKGYGAIPEEAPLLRPQETAHRGEERLKREVRQLMVSLGFYEVITYSFISPKSLEALRIPSGDHRASPLPLLNPLSEEQSVMRTSLLPGLLETARFNLSFKNEDVRIFEMRKVFFPRDGLPEERDALAALAMGCWRPRWWKEEGEKVSFYHVKGCVEALCRRLRAEQVEFSPAEGIPYLHPFQGAVVKVEGEEVGCFGRLHPEVAEAFGLPGGVYILEMDLPSLFGKGKVAVFSPLPRYPAVVRDLAVVVDEEVPAEEVRRLILSKEVPFLERVEVLDCYRGAPIPEGKKGLAFRLLYRSSSRTLTDEEVNRYHKVVADRLMAEGITLR
ncbi:MAG: phenylalanine--tRNA ligase subunit beta [Deltaproteobacteria bacterium]|nr:MAG: phenylalanine--tRNA ligase subunit beta [Deltaproteobacteria bacterium]